MDEFLFEAEAHEASDDYPELADILVERPPPEGVTRIASKTAVKFTRAERGPWIRTRPLQAYKVEHNGEHIGYVTAHETSLTSPLWKAWGRYGINAVSEGNVTRDQAAQELIARFSKTAALPTEDAEYMLTYRPDPSQERTVTTKVRYLGIWSGHAAFVVLDDPTSPPNTDAQTILRLSAPQLQVLDPKVAAREHRWLAKTAKLGTSTAWSADCSCGWTDGEPGPAWTREGAQSKWQAHVDTTKTGARKKPVYFADGVDYNTYLTTMVKMLADHYGVSAPRVVVYGWGSDWSKPDAVAGTYTTDDVLGGPAISVMQVMEQNKMGNELLNTIAHEFAHHLDELDGPVDEENEYHSANWRRHYDDVHAFMESYYKTTIPKRYASLACLAGIGDLAERIFHREPGQPGVSFDWCRFRHMEHCWFPAGIDADATEQAGYAVWTPVDRGKCPRPKWKDQQACPIGEPGPNAIDAPVQYTDATKPWEEGGQRGAAPGKPWPG